MAFHTKVLFGTLILLNASSFATSLSSVAPPKPVQKIAIIGQGISGLGVAHALNSLSAEADNLELSLFDARSSLNPQDGAGIQLNGGLTALGKINPALQQAVMDAGMPQVGIESRTQAWDNPSSTNFDTLLQLDLPKLIRNAGGEITEGLVQDDKVLWYSIMRGALQEVLLEKLPSKISDNSQFGKKLRDIVPSDDGGGVYCQFTDDSQYGPFDLVIGCDGVKSAVKEYMRSGKIENGEIGLYSGIRIKFAVRDGDNADNNNPTTTAKLTQYFGDGGYALDGTYGNGKDQAPTKCGFLVYLDEGYIGPFKKKENTAKKAIDENVDWAQDNRLQGGADNMLAQIKKANIPDFELEPVVANADRFFELGVYFHNPFNRWSKEIGDGSWAVLMGDAAHAMPPFLGQGANQALQDAYTLGSKICEYNALVREQAGKPVATTAEDEEEEEDKSLKALLKEYEQTRWFPTFSITLKSTFLGYLETGGFEGAYAKFRDVFFKAMGFIGVARKVLLDAATPKL